MIWLATKISLGIILAYLFALLCAYNGAQSPLIGFSANLLLAIPALLLFDLGRYGLRCWRCGALAD